MKIVKSLVISGVILTLALSGCSKTDKAKDAATDAADPKTNATKMITITDQIQASIEAKKADEIKSVAPQLEDTWGVFEDGVKATYPDDYVNVEKYLDPLLSGAKQDTVDFDAVDKLNKGLNAALQQLSKDLNGAKTAVDADAMKNSKELQAATQSYITYVKEQGDLLVTELQSLTTAIGSGDLAKAQAQYVQSRIPYERIEPIIEKFSDLDGAMDARVDDFDSENDPKFTGYHRIEDILFVKKTLDGAKAFADELLENGKKMREGIQTVVIEPVDFVTGVGELMEEAQTKKITGEEERWSGASLPVLRANVEGAEKIFTLVQSELEKKDAALKTTIAQSLQSVLDQIDVLSAKGTDLTSFDKLTQAQKVDLKNKLEALAEPMARMPGVLGG